MGSLSQLDKSSGMKSEEAGIIGGAGGALNDCRKRHFNEEVCPGDARDGALSRAANETPASGALDCSAAILMGISYSGNLEFHSRQRRRGLWLGCASV
jgi:hypothetical protein